MPRIIVTTNSSQLPDNASVLLDERVHSVHLSTDHAAAQLVERLAWAVSDAEQAEDTRPDSPARPDDHAWPDPPPARRRPTSHARVRRPVRA